MVLYVFVVAYVGGLEDPLHEPNAVFRVLAKSVIQASQADCEFEVPKAPTDQALVLESVKSSERDVPDYIEADHGKMSAKFLRTPKLADVPYAVQMQPSLVVEFYSR